MVIKLVPSAQDGGKLGCWVVGLDRGQVCRGRKCGKGVKGTGVIE